MSSLPSFDTENEPKIARSVEKFFKDYKVMELLRRCGLRKSKGIPLWSILSYIFSNVFRDRSMSMQQVWQVYFWLLQEHLLSIHAEPTYQLASLHYSAS